MTLFSIYIICLAACVDSIIADTHIRVSARIGSTVLLPCKMSKVFTQTPLVRWRTEDEFVFERSIDGTSAGPEYEGRVDVPVDELLKGNCSLVLKDVRITDDDVYKSFVVEHMDSSNPEIWHEINRVELSVDVFQITSAQVGSTVVLPCEWKNLTIQTPYVEWYIDHEIVFERKGKESFQGEGYEGRVDVPEEELLKGNCSLVLKNFNATDAAVYRSVMIVSHKNKKLVQKVKLLVQGKSTALISILTRSEYTQLQHTSRVLSSFKQYIYRYLIFKQYVMN
ncbi:butyrophilin subfamily 1 member A1-like isoform X1 [Silurus meridionalis]|uniref:butyrophilin subfamily 1 member A1-like isoform X1 n=2 Tax=Silurus meridionalis TaxID=175797 RepID=UPI001EEC30CC|nr:butyrophilin subfamily 1 member A1-like isoform X1 [Silurus meridionalis]XP_046715606.1 butyrophilin subfamily 1 member A1-like isoform X1 [Silurus meridionalis]